jgi:hypothetical protein
LDDALTAALANNHDADTDDIGGRWGKRDYRADRHGSPQVAKNSSY